MSKTMVTAMAMAMSTRARKKRPVIPPKKMKMRPTWSASVSAALKTMTLAWKRMKKPEKPEREESKTELTARLA